MMTEQYANKTKGFNEPKKISVTAVLLLMGFTVLCFTLIIALLRVERALLIDKAEETQMKYSMMELAARIEHYNKTMGTMPHDIEELKVKYSEYWSNDFYEGIYYYRKANSTQYTLELINGSIFDLKKFHYYSEHPEYGVFNRYGRYAADIYPRGKNSLGDDEPLE